MKVLGIDLGGTQIRGSVIDEDGNIEDERAEETLAQEGKDAVIDRLKAFIDDYLRDNSEIKAVGIGAPGPLDYSSGTIFNTPNLPGWESVPLKAILTEAFPVPIFLERDANATLLGEQWLGEAEGIKHAVLLTWGTGVGGALLFDWKIYHGHSSLAGEIGHMIIDRNGPECPMGHWGCLESFIGGAAVQKRLGKGLKEVADGARQNVPEDVAAAQEIGNMLQIGLQNIVRLFDPELIIFDGSVMQSIDVFLPKIADWPVKVSRLATKAGIIGAARLALDGLKES